MSLDKILLDILACPEDKGPLYYFEDEDALYNPRLHRRYRIRDDIPVMLVDEAETVDDAEHEFSHYEALGQKNPFLAFVLSCGVCSLAGVPPFAGFIAKLLLFVVAF